MYSLCIHNIHILTAIQTDSWTKYFIDKYLPWIMCTEWLTACHMCFLNTLWAEVFSIIFSLFFSFWMLAFNFVLWPSLLTAILCHFILEIQNHSLLTIFFTAWKGHFCPKMCTQFVMSYCTQFVMSYCTRFVMSELFMCFSLSYLNSLCGSVCHVWTLYVVQFVMSELFMWFSLSCLNSLCGSVCHVWTLYVVQFVMSELFMWFSLSCLNSLCVSVHCFCTLSFFLPFFLFLFLLSLHVRISLILILYLHIRRL